jgi:hypothetical protein
MKKVIRLFAMAMTLAILAGCAGNKELVKAAGISTRQDVFQEVYANLPPVPGYVDLRIYSALKTHKPGIHSSTDVHGTQEYMLLVNIDGQATTLKGRMTEERNAARSMRDPEEGEGIMYQFTKRLRAKAGAHRVVVVLPADDLIAERNVILSEGENYSLIVEPIYYSFTGKQRPGKHGSTSFKEGIKSFRLLLNGKAI